MERITHTPGFDGFPMSSPDGTMLAFSSNRRTAVVLRDGAPLSLDVTSQEGKRR